MFSLFLIVLHFSDFVFFLIIRWSKIAARLPGRNDNEIKNHWNTQIKKKLIKMGIDHITHQPLDKEVAKSNHQGKSLHTNGHHSAENDSISNSSEDNSSTTPIKNGFTTTDDSNFLYSICNYDQSLLTSLWMDEPDPLVDASWNSYLVPTRETFWKDISVWLLQDCQDFEIHDIRLMDCLNDIELKYTAKHSHVSAHPITPQSSLAVKSTCSKKEPHNEAIESLFL